MNGESELTRLQSWALEEQLEFVFRAWDQIVDSGWQPGMPPDVLLEIESRLDAHRADPSRAMTWEQVVASLPRRAT